MCAETVRHNFGKYTDKNSNNNNSNYNTATCNKIFIQFTVINICIDT